MSSPFRRRQQMVRAAMSGSAVPRVATPAAPDPATPAGQEYATLLVLLHENLRKLSDIESLEARNPVKAEMMHAFTPWIEGVLEAGKTGPAAQDDILLTNMIWAVDCGMVASALQMGEHAIRHGLAMPERFKASPAAFLVDQIADNTLDDPGYAALHQLLELQAMTEGADMHDDRRAKLAKAIGRAYAVKAETFDPADDNAPAGGKAAFAAEALAHFERAKKLDRNSGVKKDIDRMLRIQKAEAANAPTPDAATATE